MNQSEIDKLIDNGKMIYCFDFDGTLNKYVSNDLTELEVREKVAKLLRERYNDGNYIHIYTGRSYSEREETVVWPSHISMRNVAG